MTIRITDQDVVQIVETVAWTGGIVVMLVVGLLVYLMVRPPRRQAPPPDAIEAEEMLALLERMERRLEVLERAVAVEASDKERITETGEQGPETRRTK